MSSLLKAVEVTGNALYAHIRVQDHAFQFEQEDLAEPAPLAFGRHSFAISSADSEMGFSPLVRMELWGGPPPASGPGEVADGESDFAVRPSAEYPGGALVLTALTMLPYGPAFPLAGGGNYRVRVLRARGAGFRIQVWRQAVSTAPRGTVRAAKELRHLLVPVRIAGGSFQLRDSDRPTMAVRLRSAVAEHVALVRLALWDCPPPEPSGDLTLTGERDLEVAGGGVVEAVPSPRRVPERFTLEGPGSYRVRVLSEPHQWVDGYGTDGRETLHVQLWPTAP